MLISHIQETDVGQSIDLQGWIAQIRSSGKIAFILLRDGTGYLQCVIELGSVGEEVFNQLICCGIESAVALSGVVSLHPKSGAFELQVKNVSVISQAKDYPLWQKDDHGVEFLFDNRHLHLRAQSQWAIQRIRDTLIHATYDWMRAHDFTKIDAPIFTPTCAEDSTELYEVTHTNGEKMFLSQTWQMYIEAAIAAHRNVYDFGPVFRAEKSKTRRHLNELWMMDAEMAFCDFRGNMEIQEQLIYYMVQQLLEKNRTELTMLGRDISKLEAITLPFPRMTHAEVVKKLQELWSDIKDGEDLWADDEELLMNTFDQPLFVTNFPLAIKAFYMPEDPDHPGTAKCSDLLAPEGYGEVIGGSEREGNYEKLKQKIIDRGYDLEEYARYLDIRKYGGVTTSGFGFGLERLVRWMCGLHHIRETIPFPRYHNRITP
jgi:asparaginyl-tRNA synthetase